MKKHRLLKTNLPPTRVKPVALPEEFLTSLGAFWNIPFKTVRQDITIQGSPERSLWRVVMEDKKGQLFILEKLVPKTVGRKRQIASTLHDLTGCGLSRISPYLLSKHGEFIVGHEKNFWQLSRFHQGVALNRETYFCEPWRGERLADFLLELYTTSKKISALERQDRFSLKDYMDKFMRDTQRCNPNLHAPLMKAWAFLQQDFLRAYDDIPETFCHGDYHPLNIIWSHQDIRCVIDWEFSGPKKELYDIANLIGCVGMEHPNALLGGLAQAFIHRLKSSKIFSENSWRYLPEFILALRFAWLAEWLRNRDDEMIALELDYMNLLISNKNILQKTWL